MSSSSKVEHEVEMPIFTKTYDFLSWLVPKTDSFPKVHRHTITRRLLNAALDFQEEILHANGVRGRERKRRLDAADSHLDIVRLYLRLIDGQQWISRSQYEHASRMVAEMGRLLGGWKGITK